jgi:hypothetical protein
VNAISVSAHPIVVRRAEPADAEAIHSTFTGQNAIAGTLQIPYPSVEMWRKRLAEFPPDDYFLVATVAGEVIASRACDQGMSKGRGQRMRKGDL